MLDRAEPAAAGDEAQARAGLVAGTVVMTLRGPVAVETLVPGDRVLTRAGALALRAVDRRVERRARLVRISEAALGPDRPEADVIVAAGQPILVRDWRARALAGVDEALMPVTRLIDGEYIRAEATRDAVIYTLGFDIPVVVYAGGLEFACEGARVTA